MRYTFTFFVFCICISSLQAVDQKKSSSQHTTHAARYTVLQPAAERDLETAMKRIKKNDKWDWPNEYNSSFYKGYIVDINNDAQKEYVFVTFEGSGGYLALHVFHDNGITLEAIPIPATLISLTDIAADKEFVHPCTEKGELLVQANNKIYICACHYLHTSTRIIFLWENNQCKEVANKFWINEQRTLFNQLYKAHRYNDSFLLLHTFETRNRSRIPPLVDLWIRNDISLAALHNDCPYTAQKINNEIKNEKTFSTAPHVLKNAVEFNEQLIQKSIAQYKEGTRGQYSCDWLLETEFIKENITSFPLYWDPRFETLLAMTVPDIVTPEITDQPWRENIRRHLFFTSPVNIEAHRYLTFDGAYPHCCSSRGFMWCDRQEKATIVVTGSTLDEIQNMRITSKSFLVHELPTAFFESLKAWCTKNSIHHDQILFYDRFGKKTSITDTGKIEETL